MKLSSRKVRQERQGRKGWQERPATPLQMILGQFAFQRRVVQSSSLRLFAFFAPFARGHVISSGADETFLSQRTPRTPRPRRMARATRHSVANDSRSVRLPAADCSKLFFAYLCVLCVLCERPGYPATLEAIPLSFDAQDPPFVPRPRFRGTRPVIMADCSRRDTPLPLPPLGRHRPILRDHKLWSLSGYCYNPGMSTMQEILDAAQALPSAERARLIHALWETVSPLDWAPPDDDWVAEAQRRSDAYDAGEMTASPWPEVRARARRQAGLDG